MQFLVAVYIFILTISIFTLNFWLIGGIVAIGAITIALIPTFIKNKKKSLRKKIENKPKKPVVNVNKAPWYILEELPEINKIQAKKIVYIRRHLGKFENVQDFCNKVVLTDSQKEKILPLIHV